MVTNYFFSHKTIEFQGHRLIISHRGPNTWSQTPNTLIHHNTRSQTLSPPTTLSPSPTPLLQTVNNTTTAANKKHHHQVTSVAMSFSQNHTFFLVVSIERRKEVGHTTSSQIMCSAANHAYPPPENYRLHYIATQSSPPIDPPWHNTTKTLLITKNPPKGTRKQHVTHQGQQYHPYRHPHQQSESPQPIYNLTDLCGIYSVQHSYLHCEQWFLCVHRHSCSRL
ncbi:Hypothetical predicted protein [Olea europaea subsp. europaea]|uniref:Uncharacterized protein n=1 Tax=Olea europaea subsp. europaea TaxID=158383 RepID=A0A8S0UZF8_OLEEU|nr:Hypothetical predicted protein [Olea europaea subsp. europaea]